MARSLAVPAEAPNGDEEALLGSAAPGPRGCGGRRSVLLLAMPSMLLAGLGTLILLAPGHTGWRWSGRNSWRSLWSIRSPLDRHRTTSIAECVLDNALGTTWLGRAGMEINEAAQVCPESAELSEDSAKEYRKARESFRNLIAGKKEEKKHPHDKAEEALAKASETMMHMHEWFKQLQEHRERATPRVPRSLSERAGSHDGEEAGSHDSEDGEAGAGHSAEDEVEEGESFREGAKEFWEEVHEIRTASKLAREFRDRSTLAKRECAATVAGTWTSFAYAVSYISAASAECPGHHNNTHYCTADISRILGALGEMAAGSAAISAQCTSLERYIKTDPPEAAERRLSEEEVPRPQPVKRMFDLLKKGQQKKKERQEEQAQKKKERQEEQAWCAFDITQATLILARLAAEINAAYEHCAVGNVANCGGTISGVFASISMFSTWISQATVECTGDPTFAGVCAQAVTQLASGMAELSGGGFLLSDTCLHPYEGGEELTDERPRGKKEVFGEGETTGEDDKYALAGGESAAQYEKEKAQGLHSEEEQAAEMGGDDGGTSPL